jgi:putative holliday junction resolvase
MKILGIDYGRSKIGLAIGVGTLAEPLRVIRYSDIKILEQELKQIIEKENIEKVVVGISEGEMGEESKKFAEALGAETFDETLTSQDAQKLSIEAGVSRKKRKGMEDAYAATIMLQNFLDSFRP